MFGLGSSSQLGIGIAIRLNDQFSNNARAVNAQLVALRRNANSAVMGAITDSRNQAAAIAAGGAMITGGLISAAKAGAEFQHVINQVYILGGKGLGRSRSQLAQTAEDLSQMFTSDPTAIAKAMTDNVRAGVTKGLDNMTKYQIAVANATGETLEGEQGVARMLRSIQAQFDIPTENFATVANAMTAGANATQASVYSLGESMQYGGFTAKQFNLTMEETIALFGKMAQVGIQGSSAGTGLTNALMAMAKGLGPFSSKTQKEAWQGMGVDIEVVKGLANQGRMQEIVTIVSNATKTMSAIDRNAVLVKAFNMRGTRAMEAMFDTNNGKTIASIFEEVRQGVAGDLSMVQSKKMTDDLWSDILFFGNAIKRFFIKFSEAAAPALRFFIAGAIKVGKFFGYLLDTPVGKVFATLAIAGTGLITVLFAFRAAALTATIALNGFARNSAVGGFSNLWRAGMGNAGIYGAAGQGRGGLFARNAAGRMTVAAGQTVNWAGRTYRGGQILPTSLATAMGTTAVATRTSAGLLSGIGGSLARMLGPIGVLLTIASVVSALYDWIIKRPDDHKDQDPMLREYYRALDVSYSGRAQSKGYYDEYGRSFSQRNGVSPFKPVTQTININLDGKKAFTESVTTSLEKDLDREFSRSIPH